MVQVGWAPGQTFGSLTVPDATTLAKGVVQIDPVGGLAVAAGVVSLAGTGVTPGTYTKTTVDAKGRATAGRQLAAADLPYHTHVAADITSGSLLFKIQKAGADVGTPFGQNTRPRWAVLHSYHVDSSCRTTAGHVCWRT